MTQTLFPILRYEDPRAAIDWLGRAFGFEVHQIHEAPDGTVAHAELRLGDQMIMLGPGEPGTGHVYVVVDDPDARFERATAAGAEVVMPLTDTDYGSRDFGVHDPEGNRWSFGTYAPQP